MRRWIPCILCAMVSAIAARAAVVDGGTQSPFAFGAGARDLAMGGADQATCDPGTAPYWNPARLAAAQQFAISGFHSSLYESDVAYQYLGIAAPTMDFGVFGAGIYRLGIGGIEKRDAGDLRLGEIEDNRFGLYLGYGRRLAGYEVGLAITLEHHSLDDYSATSSPGVNLSLGRRFALHRQRLSSFALALTGRNVIKQGMKLADEKINYPLAADLGITLEVIPNPGWNQSAVVAFKVTKVDYLDPTVSAGIEYNLENILRLRGGIREGRISAGAGISFKGFTFDYGIVDRDLGAIHMFSLTSVFGTPLDVKRQARLQQREEAFDRLMQERLVAQNRDRVDQLVEEGRRHFEGGRLIEAVGSLDRALFLAAGSGLDTMAIATLAVEVRERLLEVTRKQRYGNYMDSAEVKYTAGDFLAARYFASLALVEMPDSDEARILRSRADEAIAGMASHEEMIRHQLWVADSLLNYGLVDQALTVLTALREVAPDNPGVGMALRKAGFEKWRAEASAAYSREQYEQAMSALDSALALFPGHEWCVSLKRRIGRELVGQRMPPPATVPDRSRPLSPELHKEVAEAYEAGQSRFKRGDLSGAIENWEKVERLAPDYSSVRSYLVNAYKFVGVELYSQNRFDEAIAVWKKAARLDPDNTEITGYIKRTEIEMRKLQELSYEQ